MDLHIRRQVFLHGLEPFLYLITEGHNIVARGHFHGNNHCLLIIVFHIAVGLGIASLNLGDIAQTDDIASRIGINYLLANLVFRLIRDGQMHHSLAQFVLDSTTNGSEALGGQFHQQRSLTNAVGSQFLLVNQHCDFLTLLTQNLQVAHGGNRTQLLINLVSIGLQFTRGALRRFHRQQHGSGIAEIIHYHDLQHSHWQGSLLEQGEAMLDFRPHLILVLHTGTQLCKDIDNTIFRHRVGFLLVHLLVGKQKIFQRLGHLLLHLFGRSSRINGGHHPLTNSELRKLVLVHLRHTVKAKHHQTRHYHEHYLVIAHGRLYMICFFCHSE